uniref:Amiloride-sensitive sodium channel n=1 Tax=Clytia hemisphaerica TaxID=252671 RepID=A0A7M6DQW2_9CNID
GRSCMFDGEPCDPGDFLEVVSAHYGLCYQYNSIYLDKEPFKVSRGGEGAGLRLYMAIPEDEFLVSRVPFNGLQIFVHPYGEPFESAIAKRVAISPGTMQFIHVEYRKSELLEDPYPSKCSTKEYDLVKKFVPYSQSMCSMDCLMKEMLQDCGCIPAEFAHHYDGGSKPCRFRQIECIGPKLANADNLVHRCRRDCPKECTSIQYGISVGQTNMGNSKIISKLSKKYNWTHDEARHFMRENIFGIDVSYTDVVYMMESLSPAQNWISLLNAIGGGLGLCMGCSLITFIEFLVFGIQSIYLYVTSKCKGDCQSQVENDNSEK